MYYNERVLTCSLASYLFLSFLLSSQHLDVRSLLSLSAVAIGYLSSQYSKISNNTCNYALLSYTCMHNILTEYCSPDGYVDA